MKGLEFESYVCHVCNLIDCCFFY